MDTRVVRRQSRLGSPRQRGLGVLVGLVGLAVAAGCGHPKDQGAGSSAGSGTASSAGPASRVAEATGPVTINIVDAAGTLQLVQDALELYRTKHPDKVDKFNTTKAPAPELPNKIKAMQGAGRMDIDLVFGGTDILAAGLEQGLWTRILPDHADAFPHVLDSYTDQAREMQKLAQDQALAVVFMPAGPLLEYNPDAVKSPPTTPAELLAWCKDHKDRFLYARPSNSGPGRTFLMGLPYLLGDKDPRDPINGWDKTWAFLKELDTCIEYYPGGTTATMKEFGEGSRDMTMTVTGWDINPRALGIVPEQDKVAAFKEMTWINDTQYMIVPRGLSPARLAVVLDVMAFLLEPAQQALTYDKGYFYPGPAVKGVTLAMAPQASQDVIKQFGRPEYDDWLAKFPHQRPLDAKAMVAAFRRWDDEVGARKTRK
ncbi:MAG: extracellular solute-binding protein [Deltaproteobacteria bacterium]|nr:MAG: extracellular solute-binding protein [Deltaproteobacteria bacterium]